MNLIIIIPITTIFLLIFLVALIFSVYSKSNAKEHFLCPVCDSTNVVESAHETNRSRTMVPVGGGTTAGGDIRVQLDQLLTLHCKDCGKGFKKNVTRTF